MVKLIKCVSLFFILRKNKNKIKKIPISNEEKHKINKKTHFSCCCIRVGTIFFFNKKKIVS